MEITTSLLRSVDNPARYYTPFILRNTPVTPEDAPVKILLVFPDLIEIGYSHTGIKILWELFSKQGALVDFMFAFNEDYRQIISPDNPLRSMIHGLKMDDFDMVGVSFQYQLQYPAFIQMLTAAGIPRRSTERTENHPLFMAGGPVVCNPEPVADLFDLVHIGEVEPNAVAIVNAVRDNSRSNAVAELTTRDGFYNPRSSRDVKKVTAVNPDTDITVPVNAPAAGIRTVHNRFSIEIQRGCTRGCRFCLAGSFYRPHREKSADVILSHIKNDVTTAGFREAGFLSLSASDHHNIESLIVRAFNDTPRGLSVSLPSLRAETVTQSMLNTLGKGRKGGFTIAPETGSERLRRVINKEMSDDDIFRSVSFIMQHGWKSIKLYFMLGLPFETEDDIERTVAFIEQVHRIVRKHGKRNTLTVSFSTFVPQPFTPFQWTGMNTPEQIEQKQQYIFNALKHRRSIKINWHDRHVSAVEGVLSRAGRNILPVLEQVADTMNGLQSWREHFDKTVWQQAFENHNISVEHETGPRNPDDVLPWDNIDLGISTSFLKSEFEKSQRGEQTPDCIDTPCSGCGICDDTLNPVKDIGENNTESTETQPPVHNRGNAHPFFLYYSKTGRAASLGHLDTMDFIIKGCMISRLPMLFSEGHNPRPRIETFDPIPVGVASQDEHIIVWLTELLEPIHIRDALNQTFAGTGFTFHRVRALRPDRVKKTARVIRKAADTRYLIRFNTLHDAETFAGNNPERIVEQNGREIVFIHRRGDGSLWKKVGEPDGGYHIVKQQIITGE